MTYLILPVTITSAFSCTCPCDYLPVSPGNNRTVGRVFTSLNSESLLSNQSNRSCPPSGSTTSSLKSRTKVQIQFTGTFNQNPKYKSVYCLWKNRLPLISYFWRRLHYRSDNCLCSGFKTPNSWFEFFMQNGTVVQQKISKLFVSAC